jgi:hypothetical protein
VSPDGLIVRLPGGYEGLIRADDLPAQTVPESYVSRIGELLDARVIRLSHADREIELTLRDVQTATESELTDPIPSFAVLWSPSVLSPEEYAMLVMSVGDLARRYGAAGVVRLGSAAVNDGVTPKVQQR